MNEAAHPQGRRRPVARLVAALASAHLTVLCLLWMGVLTVWGTLAQTNPHVGLHGATRRFFHSWFFAGPAGLPLPGMSGTSVLFLLNLIASMATRLRRDRRHAGLWLTHAGLVVLLAGAALARALSREAVLVLAEGEQSDVAVSETEWELAVIRPRPDGGRTVEAYPLRRSTARTRLPLGGSLTAEIRAIWPSIEPPARLPVAPADIRPRSSIDPRRALPAVHLVIGGEAAVLLGEGQGLAVPLPDKREVYLQLRRERHPLPVAIRLLDFEKKFHPNSRVPRSFSSRIEVTVGERAREVVIAMNRPFRHGAFAFYQSSYMEPPDGKEATVLAVAENHARPLPYAATGIIFGGMCVHYLTRRREPS